MSRLLRRESHLLDALLALLFLVGGSLEMLLSAEREGPAVAIVAVMVVVGAAVYVRRRRPIATALVFMAALFAEQLFLTAPPETVHPFLGLLLFPYAVGAYAGPRAGIAIVVGYGSMVAIVNALAGEGFVLGDLIFPGFFVTASWLAGRTMASRMRLAAELHEAAVLAREEQEAEAALAVGAERRRIAREMHDVIAHSISVMVVQAGGARRILEQDPARAEEAAARIERTGRDALTEMRRLLGVLATPEHEPGGREPAPGLHALDGLVDRARAAGVPVEVEVRGEPQPIPQGVDLAAYRIVQEALTNVLKHARGARTTVTLAWRHDALELRVRDLGGPAEPDGHGLAPGGHGLVGMRERARLYGGELEAAPSAGGGFEVRAVLPLERAAVPA